VNQRIGRRTLVLVVVAVVCGVLSSIGIDVVLPQSANAINSQFVSISAGLNGSCGITPTGGAKCWGANFFGRVGDDSRVPATTPVQVTGLTTGVTAIETTQDLTCAIAAGALKCWGQSVYTLGDGSTYSSLTPISVPGFAAGVTALSVGPLHVCVVKSGGIWCWGNNGSGQLGDGTTINRVVPVATAALSSGVTAVGTGLYHTCALAAGAVKCWGANSVNQLGDGTAIDRLSPVATLGLTSGVTAFSLGGKHACAIVSGAARCWGENNYGALGDGTNLARSTPMQVVGLTSGVTAIAAANYAVSCAVVSGAAKCWGDNLYGAVGDGTSANVRVAPVQVMGLTSGVTKISSSLDHSCAISATTQCWGDNTYGQLGSGNNTTSLVPVTVTDPSPPNGMVAYSRATILSSTSIQISWTDTSTNNIGYLVYRVLGTTQTLVLDCSTSSPALRSCIDRDLTPNTFYQYYVYTWNYLGASYPGTYLLAHTFLDPAARDSSVAPDSPAILSAAATGPHSVTVGWQDRSTNETGFKVYQYVAGTYVLRATTAANASTASFTDPAIDTTSAQVFTVTAFNAIGQTYADTYIFSTARATPTGTQEPVIYGSATYDGDSVTITWTVGTFPRQFLVYRIDADGTVSAVNCPTVLELSVWSCSDPGRPRGVYSQYYVYTYLENQTVGNPGTSMLVHTPVAGPIITDATGSSSSTITMHWQDNLNDESGYTIYEYAAGAYTQVGTTAANVTSITLTGLAPNTLHIYIVAANRGASLSYSNTGIWATTLPAVPSI
jgi:alpha-tubulin suppressor-like RCC1 family protein